MKARAGPYGSYDKLSYVRRSEVLTGNNRRVGGVKLAIAEQGLADMCLVPVKGRKCRNMAFCQIYL